MLLTGAGQRAGKIATKGSGCRSPRRGPGSPWRGPASPWRSPGPSSPWRSPGPNSASAAATMAAKVADADAKGEGGAPGATTFPRQRSFSLRRAFSSVRDYVVGSESFPPPVYEGREYNIAGRFFLLLEDPSSSLASQFISVIMMLVILASCISYVAATADQISDDSCHDTMKACTDDAAGVEHCMCPPTDRTGYQAVEALSIYLFTAEYVIRVALSGFAHPEDCGCEKKRKMGRDHMLLPMKRWHQTYYYFWHPMNLIDLIAIAPYWVEQSLGSDSGGFGFLRIFRLARVFRVFKLGKYNEGINLFKNTIVTSLPALSLLTFYTVIGVVVFGSLMFFVEQGAYKIMLCEEMLEHRPGLDCAPGSYVGDYFRPDYLGLNDELTPFKSIPVSFWWVVTTITTVGYGDFYPTSAVGRVLAACCMYIGILALALPISVLGSSFGREYDRMQVAERERKAQLQKRRASKASHFKATAGAAAMASKVSTALGSGAGAEPVPKVDLHVVRYQELVRAKKAMQISLAQIDAAMQSLEIVMGSRKPTAAGAGSASPYNSGSAELKDSGADAVLEDFDSNSGEVFER
mmetsp:Transcript_26950/g.84570  ORF Transcript_26950/g.84570 Transcript_26950/m.84570 type:complete len:578 (-) Transcript_26950:945-2678(-)